MSVGVGVFVYLQTVCRQQLKQQQVHARVGFRQRVLQLMNSSQLSPPHIHHVFASSPHLHPVFASPPHLHPVFTSVRDIYLHITHTLCSLVISQSSSCRHPPPVTCSRTRRA